MLSSRLSAKVTLGSLISMIKGAASASPNPAPSLSEATYKINC